MHLITHRTKKIPLIYWKKFFSFCKSGMTVYPVMVSIWISFSLFILRAYICKIQTVFGVTILQFVHFVVYCSLWYGTKTSNFFYAHVLSCFGDVACQKTLWALNWTLRNILEWFFLRMFVYIKCSKYIDYSELRGKSRG